VPVLIDLRLKAPWTLRPDTEALHGLACALFEDDASEHLGQEKPFAIWPLAPAPPGGLHDWEWRAAWLPDDLLPAAAQAPDQLQYRHVTCTVTEAWHRRVTRAQLAARPPMSSAAMSFESPTYFSQNGNDQLLPDPRLITRSWWRHWNASLPEGSALAIKEETWRQTHRAIRLGEFNLRTDRRDSGYGDEQPGFTGSAILRIEGNATADVRAVFGTLVRFAEFCGTGAQTTHGFGATALGSARSRSGDG
jgi:CRISPR-associated endoribonuclease Cas6